MKTRRRIKVRRNLPSMDPKGRVLEVRMVLYPYSVPDGTRSEIGIAVVTAQKI